MEPPGPRRPSGSNRKQADWRLLRLTNILRSGRRVQEELWRLPQPRGGLERQNLDDRVDAQPKRRYEHLTVGRIVCLRKRVYRGGQLRKQRLPNGEPGRELERLRMADPAYAQS